MADINKHGLSRNIGADVKRELRQRCGFGCVKCGFIFYEYEHFAPDFVDAKSHDPKGMTLLCSQCNQRRRKGVLSAETVAWHNDNPHAIIHGQAKEWLDISHESVTVELGGSVYINCRSLITIRGQSVFSITPPVEQGAPYNIAGLFADDTGAITLKIEDNHMIIGADNWDVRWQGKTLTILKSPRNISLKMTLYPPHRIVIEKLEMELDGVKLSAGAGTTKISTDRFEMEMQKATVLGPDGGIRIS
jgi:hypothetical protein